MSADLITVSSGTSHTRETVFRVSGMSCESSQREPRLIALHNIQYTTILFSLGSNGVHNFEVFGDVSG